MAPVELLRSNDQHGLHWAKAYVGQPIRCALLFLCCFCCVCCCFCCCVI
jgi:hypothetical protein